MLGLDHSGLDSVRELQGSWAIEVICTVRMYWESCRLTVSCIFSKVGEMKQYSASYCRVQWVTHPYEREH